MKPIIRVLRSEDTAQALEIYRPYVIETPITFEFDPPTLSEFAARAARIAERYPYLVCEQGGVLLGYAYASEVRSRIAYQWGAELSVYLRPSACRRGIGSALYGALFELLRAQGINTVYGCITSPNPSSERMHEVMGFERAGFWKNAGYKNGQWRDVAWYRREIAPPAQDPSAPLRFCALPASFVEQTLDWASACIRS